MKWTNEKPTEIGDYWYRDDKNDMHPVIVWVTGESDGIPTTVVFEEMFHEVSLSLVKGQWCRIPEPED